MCFFFSSFRGFLSCSKFCDFLVNKSWKTYLGLMLPPVGRNWQLISPHFTKAGAWMCFLGWDRLYAEVTICPVVICHIGVWLIVVAPLKWQKIKWTNCYKAFNKFSKNKIIYEFFNVTFVQMTIVLMTLV